jgi:hypothetical protein
MIRCLADSVPVRQLSAGRFFLKGQDRRRSHYSAALCKARDTINRDRSATLHPFKVPPETATLRQRLLPICNSSHQAQQRMFIAVDLASVAPAGSMNPGPLASWGFSRPKRRPSLSIPHRNERSSPVRHSTQYVTYCPRKL